MAYSNPNNTFSSDPMTTPGVGLSLPVSRYGPETTPSAAPYLPARGGTTPRQAPTFYPSNESDILSQEPIVQTSYVKKLESEPDYKLFPGDILFVRGGEGSNGTPRVHLNVAQFAEQLHKGYNRLEEMYSDPTKVGDGQDRKIVELYRKYKQEGESVFLENDKEKVGMLTDKAWIRLMFVSGYHIASLWKKTGMFLAEMEKESLGYRYRSAQKVINIQYGGPTEIQELKNYWPNACLGHFLYLICRKKENGPFEIVPWSGPDKHPPHNLSTYYDDAGILQNSICFFVGRCIDHRAGENKNNQYSDILTGRTVGAIESQIRTETASDLPTLVVLLGTRKHDLSCIPY